MVSSLYSHGRSARPSERLNRRQKEQYMSSNLNEIGPEEQDRMLKLLRKHSKDLLKYPNVHRVDVGFEFKGGKPTGRLSIRAHVTEKKANRALPVKDRLPTELDGVPVDVI